MKDEWIKAAGAMGGIVHFGGDVGVSVTRRCCRRYCRAVPGVAVRHQGFPTIKIFSPLRKQPTDYQQAREAKPFCKAAFAVRALLARDA